MPTPKRRRSPREIAAELNATPAASHPADGAAGAAEGAPPRGQDTTAAAALANPTVAPDTASPPPGPVGADVGADVGAATAATTVRAPELAERVRARSGRAELLVFRVGGELFGVGLAAIEEAVERLAIESLPEMPPSMLGVATLRGRMLPAYSPARPLGVALASDGAAALVARAGDRRVALCVDDVDDVMILDLAALRPAPGAAGERDASGIVLGVARRGPDLVTVLDADALLTACLTDRALETV